MIACKFQRRDSLLTGFSLTGHAGHAPVGEDIVCAAVSAACDLTVHQSEEYFGCKPDIRTRDGEILFSATENLPDADRLLRAFRDYLESVAAQYPQCIQIDDSEV